MTARALVAGALFRAPESKTSKSGRTYLLATIREGGGEVTRWWKAFIFSASAIEEVQRLGDGDPIAVAGEIDAQIYTPAGSESRINLSVRVDAVLSARRYIIWWPAAGFEVRDHALADWPTWLSEEPKAATAIPTTNVRPFIPEDTHKRGSLDAKIVGIAKRLERAKEGERNAILFWAACRVGAMLREGELSRFVSERWCADLLALAAARAGLPDQEARRTIASGFGKVA